MINSLPSMVIALITLGLWAQPAGIAAMLAAIGTFILLYATLTSLDGPLADERHVLSRALRLGSKIRVWISGISLFFAAIPPFMMFLPDFWCGFLASNIVNDAGRSFGFAGSPGWSQNTGFLKIYAITMLEGFILSFILAMISFFAVIYLQARDRRKFLTLA